MIAHELAHHSRDHLWKLIGWYALFALPMAWLIALATRRRGGMYEPRAVPLALLVAVVLQIAVTPAQNAVVTPLRGRGGLGRAPDHARPGPRTRARRGPGARRATPIRSRRMGDGPVRAPIPTTMQRIAMAEAWQARNGRRALDRLRALTSQPPEEVTWKQPRHQPSTPAHRRRDAGLPGPLRRRVPGAPLALEDLRQVAVRDPALHHRAILLRSSPGMLQFIAFFAILFTKKWPRGLFDFTVQIQRWTANVAAYACSCCATSTRRSRATPGSTRSPSRSTTTRISRAGRSSSSGCSRSRTTSCCCSCCVAANVVGHHRLLRDPVHGALSARDVRLRGRDHALVTARQRVRALADDGSLSAVQPEVSGVAVAAELGRGGDCRLRVASSAISAPA